MQFTIEATVVTCDANGEKFRTEKFDVQVEAVSYKAACRIVREMYASPCTSVFIESDEAEAVQA
jgi:hypothetical protein